MPRERKIFPMVLSVVVFVVLEIVSLRMVAHGGHLQGIWMSKVAHSFMAKVWGGSQNIKRYFNLNKENKELAEENFRLLTALREFEWEERQFRSDSTLGSMTVSDGFLYTPASIVKISRNRQHNYLIINKGSEDGIKPRSGIISSRGIIGIVDEVEKHFSYALSFMNPEISISARLGGEGAVGPLTWDGKSSDGAVLSEIPLQYKFEPGDTVYTSGYSSLFPSDIPLGVAGESRIVNGATNQIKVKLFQDYTTIKYVIVVGNEGQNEIKALEQHGKEEKKKR